jgi:hypothetical protein
MSFAELPDDVLGKIGDFLTPIERAKMRQTSRLNKTIYRAMPAYEYLVKSRLSLIHLKSGRSASVMTSENRLQQNIYSSEIGTKEERERSLQTDIFRLIRLIQQENFNFFDFLTDDLPPPPIDVRESWIEVKEFIVRLFIKRGGQESVFSQSELTDLIKQRSTSSRYPFPVTFVKVNEINLLDYALLDEYDFDEELNLFTMLGTTTTVKTIDDLVYFFNMIAADKINLDWSQESSTWMKNVLIAFLGGDETASIDPLKEFFTVRYTHEIHVERHKLDA